MTSRLAVFVDDLDAAPVLAGTAYFTQRRSTITTSFSYDPDYLTRGYAIDPAVPLTGGAQHTDGLPGAFQDCAPDRWGRNLVIRRLRAVAREAQARLRDITEVDYLIGVSDLTRQGALRFKLEPDTPRFENPESAVPKLLKLPRLLAAADSVAEDDDLTAVKVLLEAGSGSLGGARPKASVEGDDGDLLIAKFPHHSDEWDVMAWEKTALDLASRAGIPTPRRRLTLAGNRHVLLLERFDREAGQRRGYVSAMTLVGGRDGQAFDYEDISDALADHGTAVRSDLADLFRRVAFSVAIHNTDDHLRNHGLLRSGSGWVLSPLFDVNPNPHIGESRQTSIAGATTVDDEADGLAVLAEVCRLSAATGTEILDAVTEACGGWRDVARSNAITSSGIGRFEETFEVGAATVAAARAALG